MLDLLPNEILFMIAEKLSQKSLCSFSQVCLRMREILIPLVYHNITFSAANEWALNVLNIETYFQRHQAAQPDHYLRHTRELCFSAPISIVRFNRCACYNIFRVVEPLRSSVSLGASNDTTAHLQFSNDLSEQVGMCLRWLRPHYLRSFRWHLGCCLPAGILDESGCLTLQQNYLRSISLITDASCPHAGKNTEGLSSLQYLQKLGWEGIQHPTDINSFRKCILRNHKHLTHLSVKFVASANVRELCWGKLQDVTEGNQGGVSPPQMICLPSILNISLSNITFSTNACLNTLSIYPSLRELTLRYCSNQLGFLSSLSGSKETLKLQRFEICCDTISYDSQYTEEKSLLGDFLISFQGLQSLHLKLSNFQLPATQILEVIRRHEKTLEDFVYHETRIMSVDRNDLYEESRDATPSWLPYLSEILYHCQLTELGLCASFKYLRACLEPVALCSSLTVLHIRLSGSQYNHRNLRREFFTRLEEIQFNNSPIFDCIHQVNSVHLQNGRKSPDSPICDWIAKECPPISTMEDSQGELSGFSFEVDDLLNFANWIFGPNGVRGLKLLAVGDFSHKDEYPRQQFLLGRNNSKGSTNTFRLLSGDELRPYDLNFFSSCPEDEAMESPYAW